MSQRGMKAFLYNSKRPSAHDVLRAERHDSDTPPPSFRGTRPSNELKALLEVPCAEEARPVTPANLQNLN